jgi:phytoene desaturase
MASHTLIIGSGIGGLSAAVRLAARGHRVTVVEKNPQIGGKLNRWIAPHPGRPQDNPFYFDTGPSLITLPFVFEETFAAAGRKLTDYLTLTRLDPIQKYIWADGTTLSGRSTPADLATELSRFTQNPDEVAAFQRILAKGKMIWDESAELFLYHAPEQVLKGDGKFDPRRALSMLTIPIKIGMFANFAKWINREVSHPRLREVLYQYATYSGASPFMAPATLLVIPFAEYHFGGWYIPGGLYSLALALEKLGRELGVTYLTSSPVDQILIEPTKAKKKLGQVRGVRLATGQEIPADSVLANSDVVYTYQHLIPPRYRKKYSDPTLKKLEPGGSGLVLLLGVDGRYDHLAHHTKFMPNDYASDLRAMFETKTLPDDPCIYVCASTRTDPTQAPDGCENLFVLASAPAIDGKLDWHNPATEQAYRDKLVHLLETRYGLTDLSRRIVVEKRYSPLGLQSAYNANAGSIYGIGSNSRRAAFLRPPNRDRDVAGLYFAGGATHPGGGVPLVALSGKIAAELIEEDLPHPSAGARAGPGI